MDFQHLAIRLIVRQAGHARVQSHILGRLNLLLADLPQEIVGAGKRVVDWQNKMKAVLGHGRRICCHRGRH